MKTITNFIESLLAYESHTRDLIEIVVIGACFGYFVLQLLRVSF